MQVSSLFRSFGWFAAGAALVALSACGGVGSGAEGTGTEAANSNGVRSGVDDGAMDSEAVVSRQFATLGETAPDFTLNDIDGTPVSLSQFKGKVVVLEWFNPQCPFVRLAHDRELSLKGMAAKWSGDNIVWLAINSGARGKQGHGVDVNSEARKMFKFDYPILMDEAESVGRMYQAQRTPHMFVIDASGRLVYEGAIDNTSGGDPSDADPPPARNLVEEVLSTLVLGKEVTPSQSKSWGCSVKYDDPKK